MGRHALPETIRKYQIGQMWDIHHEICRLAVIGMKSIDIAGHLNVTPAMVSYVLNSDIVKRQLSHLHAVRDLDSIDVAKEIQELTPRAIKKLDTLLDCGDTKIESKVAMDILDRAGYAAVKTLRTSNIHAHFTKDELDDIKLRAKEVGLLTDYIDVEIEDAINS